MYINSKVVVGAHPEPPISLLTDHSSFFAFFVSVLLFGLRFQLWVRIYL